MSTGSGSALFFNWTDSTIVSLVNGHSSLLTSMDMTQDSALLATASVDGSLAIWRMDTLEQTVLFKAPKKSCNCVAFDRANEPGSPSVVAGYSDGTLRVFDLNSLKMSVKMKPHSESVQAVIFSIQGEQYYSD